jgi:hypothetical protein
MDPATSPCPEQQPPAHNLMQKQQQGEHNDHVLCCLQLALPLLHIMSSNLLQGKKAEAAAR